MTRRFVEVDIVMGRHTADLIQSLLEANGIPTELSQESVGAVTGFTVGPMVRSVYLCLPTGLKMPTSS
jgi:hypothetical protein